MASTVPLGDKQLTRIRSRHQPADQHAENREFLKAAVAETALNHIDTAHLYTAGESEQTIGAALSPFPDDLLVATKGGYNEGGGDRGVPREFEESFERRTEVIELYYQHRVHPDLTHRGREAVLNEYREAGRSRHIGISAVTIAEIERARSVAPSPRCRTSTASSRGHTTTRSTTAPRRGSSSSPTSRCGERTRRRSRRSPRHMARRRARSAWRAHEALADDRDDPGTLSLEHLEENLGALEIELTDAEFDRLNG